MKGERYGRPEQSRTVRNREDTEEQASKGGQASSGSFGSSNSADPSQAAQKGAEAQPTEAKARGGETSHQNSNN